MPEQVHLTVAQDTILSLVKGQIQAQLVDALEKNSHQVLESIVRHAMSREVEKGYKRMSAIDWTISEAIEAEVKECMKEWVSANRPKIREAFERQLTSRRGGVNALAKAMVDKMCDRIELGLDLNVKLARD